MTSIPTSQPAPKRRLSGLVAIVSLVAIAASVGAILLQMNPQHNMRKDLETLKRLGQPTEVKEVLAIVRTGSPNAAPVLRKALDTWGKYTAKSKREAMWLSQKLNSRLVTKQDLAEVHRTVGQFKPALSLVAQASAMPVCNWERNWADGTQIFFNETAEVRKMVMMLLLRARAAALEGRYAEAVNDIRVSDRIATLSADDPAMAPFMSSLNLKMMCDAAVRKMLSESKLDVPSLEALQEVLDSGSKMPDLRYGLNSELTSIRIALNNVDHLYSLVEGVYFDGKEYDFTKPEIRKEAEAKIIKAWRTAWERLPKDQGDWKKAFDAFEAGTHVLTRDQSPSGRLCQHLWQHYGLSVDNLVRANAHRRMAQTAVRVKLLQAKNGSLPNQLPDFGAASVDPFDGKQIRYKPAAGEFMLYSVGSDGDQGGATHKDLYNSGKSDIVWTVQA